MKTLVIFLLLVVGVKAGEQTKQDSQYNYWGKKLMLNAGAVVAPDSLVQQFIQCQYDNAPLDSNGIELPNVYYRRISEDGQKGWLKIGRRTKTERNGHIGLSYYNIETIPIFDLTMREKK